MKKLIVTIFLLLLSVNTYAQNCIVFGKITDQSGTAIKGSKVTIRDVRKDGNLIDLGPRNYFTNSKGWFYIPVIQGATAKLYANVAGFNTPGGVTISIPAVDSVNIDTLQTIAAVSTAGLTVKKNGTSLTGKYGILDFQKQFMLWTDNSQEINIKIKPYSVGYNAEDTTSLAVAIDAAAADTAAVIVSSAQSITQTARDTLPTTAQLIVRRGGQINVTKKFTIEGNFWAGPYQVFYGNLDSVEFRPGSVDFIRPEWFGATPALTDSSDDYAALQAAINVAEASMEQNKYDLSVYLADGVFHLSDTLLIQDHGLKIRFQDAILRPWGTFAGPLVHIKGDQSTRTAKIPENWHRARVDVDGLYIDGLNQSRGILVEDVMQGLFNNIHIERVSGYAVKMDKHKESVWQNLNIQTSDAGTDSALLWIGGETGSEDGTNQITFVSPKITYCGGRYVYVGNSSTIVPRHIIFIAPQFHHLDTDAANQNANVSIDSTGNENVIWIENGENIHFLYGLIRLPAAPKGEIVTLGSATGTPIRVTFTRTKFSSNADSVTAIDVVSAGNTILDDVHFVLQGTGSTRYFSPQISLISADHGIDQFGATATTDTVLITGVNSNSSFLVSPYLSSPTTADILSWTVTTDTLFVYRSGTTSGTLKYSWMRLK